MPEVMWSGAVNLWGLLWAAEMFEVGSFGGEPARHWVKGSLRPVTA